MSNHSNRQNYSKTNLVLLYLGLADECAKPSYAIGDAPIQIRSDTPVLHEPPHSL